MTRFVDRIDAGSKLAQALLNRRTDLNAIVLALPRGGVPVGYQVAKRLGCPLDILSVRKLGLPSQPELAMGAIAEGHILVLNGPLVRELGIRETTIDAVAAREGRELDRRAALYRDGRSAPDLRGLPVILVDDGCATGSNMRAAVEAVRILEATRVTVAVPVASREASRLMESVADEFVCIEVPRHFVSVGQYYSDFTQVSDAEVERWLTQASKPAEIAGE